MAPVPVSTDQDQPSPLRSTGRYVLLVALALLFVFPIVFMLFSSLKPNQQIFIDVRSFRAFLPVGDISIDNYQGVFNRVPVLRFLFNSIFVTTVTVTLGLLFNSMAAFALSRMRWRGQNMLLLVIIATLIVPLESIAVPMLLLVSVLPWIGFDGLRPILESGWLNSYHVQIIPFIANAFGIFLFYTYFQSLPRELDEAARIDGASWLQIYRRVIVPLSGPVFATVAILTALPAWNAYLWPLMVAQSEDIRPVMVGLQYFFQLDVAWGEVMAYASIITVPVLALFLAFQRAFIQSIASTGLKG
jgi:multiple sugar transport system permease protein